MKNMVIELNGKSYPLHFGFSFLRDMNALSESGDMNKLFETLGGLFDESALALFDLIKAGLNTHSDVTDEDIEEYLIKADLSKLSKDFLAFLKSFNLTKKQVNHMMPILLKAKELAKKEQEQAILELDKELNKELNKA